MSAPLIRCTREEHPYVLTSVVRGCRYQYLTKECAAHYGQSSMGQLKVYEGVEGRQISVVLIQFLGGYRLSREFSAYPTQIKDKSNGFKPLKTEFLLNDI
jgi:hypothetical protein